MKRQAGRHHRFQIHLPLTLVTLLLLGSFLAPVALGATVNLSQEETRMLQLVNEARKQAGLSPLYPEQRLTDMARDYCREMIQYGFFGHNSPVSGGLQQRIAVRGITGWLLAGENLAKAPTVDVAFKALMNSPSHRENILRPQFNCVGIGVVRGPDGLYVTQEFMQFAQIPPTADTSTVSGATAGTVSASQPIQSQSPSSPAATSGDRSDTYILVVNPGSSVANVRVVLRGEDGREVKVALKVKPNCRCTVNARQVYGQGSFATEVQSDAPVLAERAMYFSLGGRRGGHDSIGCASPSKNWYFAEGFTGGSFDTWILLQNPNDGPAAVTLRFMRSDGKVVEKKVTVQARRRHTVHVDEVPGLENAEVSTSVTSDLPVVAERAMYFVYEGKKGGHCSVGARSPSNRWYLAEGYTGGSFNMYVLLQNPSGSEASAQVRFFKGNGECREFCVSLPPRTRRTLHVNRLAGLAGCEVGVQVQSDLPVVVERSQYFDYSGLDDGTNSIGAVNASRTWYFAEGYCR